MVGNRPKLVEALPTLGSTLKDSLLREGEDGLAKQVDTAEIHAFCECDLEGCRSFWLAPPMEGKCEGEYRVVLPDAVISIGVCDEKMGWVHDERLGQPYDAARHAECERLKDLVPGHPL